MNLEFLYSEWNTLGYTLQKVIKNEFEHHDGFLELYLGKMCSEYFLSIYKYTHINMCYPHWQARYPNLIAMNYCSELDKENQKPVIVRINDIYYQMNFTGDENQENSELSIMANSYPSSNALTRISTRCREKTISFDHIPTVHSKEQFYEDVVIFADNTLERLRFSASMYGIRIGIRILPDYLLVDLNEYISNSLSRLRNAKLIIVHSGNVDFNVYHISNDEILTCFKQTVVYLQNKTFKDECKICLSALMPLTKQNGTRKSIDDLNLAIENLCKNEKNVIFHENINRLKCSLTVGEWPRLEALSHEDVSKYQNSIDKLITSNLVEQI